MIVAFQEGKKILTDKSDFGASASFIIWSLLIIGLIIVAWIILRKFTKGTHGFFSPGVINILARRKLSPSHEIYLVEIGPRLLLIGLTRDKLETLSEFANVDEVSSIKSRFASKGFQEVLKNEKGEKEEDSTLKIKEQLKQIQSTVSSWQ